VNGLIHGYLGFSADLPYKGRASVEREFGRLKNEWALLPLRVRGLERVKLHAA
jgi:hypothetical protein